MKVTDNSALEFNKLLNRLKLAAYISFIIFSGILIAYAVKFGSFTDFLDRLSNLPDDWSAFGSLLSGASSFMGAVGTVGVMVLAIKQFKIQQKQIEAQNERQNKFEKLQQEKWETEDEMIKQQRFIEHQNQFITYIHNFESYSKFKVNNKLGLYKKLFPHNNHENIYLISSFNENGSHLLETAKNEIEELYFYAHSYEIDTHVLFGLLIKSLEIFNLKYPATPISGDIFNIKYENSGINIFRLDSFFEDLKKIFESMAMFSNSNLKIRYKLPEKKCLYNLERFAIENLTDLGFEAKIFTTCNGVKELIALQMEVKKFSNIGLPFEPIEFSNHEYMKKMASHWERIISFINDDEQIPNELQYKLSEFNSARFHNSVAREMYRKRSNRL